MISTLHYRQFLEDQIGGWYYGIYVASARIEGRLKSSHRKAKQSKFGIGGEIGYSSYKLFYNNDLYWNFGIGLGTYIGSGSKHNIFRDQELRSDSRAAHFLDILRIGILF